MKLKQKLIWFFRKKFKNYKLSDKMKKRSIKEYNKLEGKFVKNNKRKPNRTEKGFLIISSSHEVCRSKGKRGHRIRQKVREYLFNMNGIDYKQR